MDTQRLKEIFDREGAFAIVVGSSYTVDEMASALSVYLTLKSNGKDVSIVSAKQPLVEVSNLIGIDRVTPSFESNSGDLIVSFPYQQDEIGKVSYTLENGLLNIIVKPKDAPLSFGEKDVIFKRSGSLPAVVITVGVKRISELQSFFDVQSLKDTVIINIDKAGNNEGFGDVVIIGQGASSVSEQVANLILSLNYELDPDIAQNLMSGVISATGNFQSPRTSSLAFEMAGLLLRAGAKREVARPTNQPQRTPQQFGYNPRGNQPQPQNMPRPGQPRSSQMPRPPRNPNPGLSTQPMPGIQTNPAIPTMPSVPPMPRPQIEDTDNLPQPKMSGDYQKEQKLDDAPIDGPDAPPDWLAPKIYKGSTNLE